MTRLLKAGCVALAILVLASACGGDDETLYKWDCACTDACAATQAEAEKRTHCATVNVSICHSTGDTCVCPGGAKSCDIRLP